MSRNYRHHVDNSRRRKYTDEQLNNALTTVKSGKMSIRKAVHKFQVPRSTIQDYLKKTNAANEPIPKLGRKKALTDIEEKVLVDILSTCAKWGFPFKVIDVRKFVKDYLDSIAKKVPQFADNLPGEEWGRSFMKRHRELSDRFAENIKRSRAEVTPEELTRYFDELKITLDSVDKSCIVNYDETNFVDDPGRTKYIFNRGGRADNVLDHSKTATSVMFAVAANGKLLKPYVVYKSKNLYNTWILGGPTGTAYNRCPSGWFTENLFEDWFDHVPMPYFRRFEGAKILIGDNLCSHVSFKVIKKCIDNNIRFVLFVPNSTHLCQPLDVGVFRSIKAKWRGTLQRWKLKHRGIMQKHDFPELLKTALEKTVNMKQNIVSSFRGTGIHPWDPEQVLKRLPRQETEADIVTKMLTPLVSFLKKYRFPETDQPKKGRKRKITTPAGRAITLADFGDENKEDSSSENDGEGIDNEEVASSSSSQEETDEEEVSNSSSSQEEGDDKEEKDSSSEEEDNQDDIIPTVDGFFAVKFHTEHENHCKVYIGKVQEIDGDQITLQFLRRQTNYFVYPLIDDVDTVRRNALIKKMSICSVRRGKHVFYESIDGML